MLASKIKGGPNMYNFTFHNPVKIVFGKGTISELSKLIRSDKKIMMTYGGGSIKGNRVYDQVIKALKGYNLIEFGGIGPNPEYSSCLKAVEKAKENSIDFLLSVGGGSVLDATKFIAAAIRFQGPEPWDILTRGAEETVTSAVPLGSVLTLPATGSEMNTNSVISRKSTGQKLPFSSSHVYAQFSILDPETTYTLPEHQVVNGIVDTFIHVTEQYLTFDVNAPLQDRLAEAILLTLIEEAPKVKSDPRNYDVRANLMWCATMALNGLIGCGVAEDWTTHQVGHELTALHGLDHAQTLAIVMPAVIEFKRSMKKQKLIQYGRRIWGIEDDDDEKIVDRTIAQTVKFFNGIGMPTRLRDYNLTPDDCMVAAEKIEERGIKLGENKDIGKNEIEQILKLCA
jgi:NADP-dependent alcohol dehydrogenase